MFSNNRKMVLLMTSFCCLQVSFLRLKGKCSHLWFYLEFCYYYFFVHVRYWCYYLNRWHLFILWSYFILFLFYCETSWGTDVLVQRSFVVGWTSLSTDVMVLRLFSFIYFVFSSGVENRTLSQMCGRLYLPIFLLRVGLWTLMYIFLLLWSWPYSSPPCL